MTIGDGVVKYKQRMRVEPSKIQLEEAKPEKAASAQRVPVRQERVPRALPKALSKKSGETPVKQEETKSPKESKETRSPKESTETRLSKESKETQGPVKDVRKVQDQGPTTKESAKSSAAGGEDASDAKSKDVKGAMVVPQGAKRKPESQEIRASSAPSSGARGAPESKASETRGKSKEETEESTSSSYSDRYTRYRDTNAADYGRSSEEEEEGEEEKEEEEEEDVKVEEEPTGGVRLKEAQRRPTEPSGPPPDRLTSRPKKRRSEWTEEEKRADNWNARQRKKARHVDQGKGSHPTQKGDGWEKSGKTKGKTKGKNKGKSQHQVYAVTCDPDLWIHAVDDFEAQGEDHWTVSPDGKRVTYNHHTPGPRRGLYTPN